jgi:hypothetical protein
MRPKRAANTVSIAKATDAILFEDVCLDDYCGKCICKLIAQMHTAGVYDREIARRAALRAAAGPNAARTITIGRAKYMPCDLGLDGSLYAVLIDGRVACVDPTAEQHHANVSRIRREYPWAEVEYV